MMLLIVLNTCLVSTKESIYCVCPVISSGGYQIQRLQVSLCSKWQVLRKFQVDALRYLQASFFVHCLLRQDSYQPYQELLCRFQVSQANTSPACIIINPSTYKAWYGDQCLALPRSSHQPLRTFQLFGQQGEVCQLTLFLHPELYCNE